MHAGGSQPDLERFRDLAEQALDLIAELDGEGRIRYANPSYESVLGYEPDRLLGTSIFDLVHPDDLEQTLAIFDGAIAREEADEAFCRVFARDGSLRWMHSRGRPYRSATGELRIALASRDIIDRLDVHAALRASERRFRALVETANCGIVESALDGRIKFTNRAFADMLGIEPEDLVGRGLWEFHHDPDERARVRKALAGGLPHRPEPVRRLHWLSGASGFPLAVEVDWNYRTDDDGEVTGLVTIVTDVTRREQADAALAESHRFIERLADTSPTMICVFDLRDHSLSYANSRIHAIMGWRVDDLRAFGGRIFTELIHPEDQRIVARLLSNALRASDDVVSSAEYRVRHADGDWRWVHAHFAVFSRNEDGRPVEILSTQVDVTERRVVEDALRAQEARFRLIAESAYDYILELDTDGEVAYLSPSFGEILGFDPENFRVADAIAAVHRQDGARVGAEMEKLLAGERIGPVVYRHLDAWGRWHWLETYGTPFPAAEGYGAVAITRDITEQRQAEEEARRLEEQLLQTQKLESLGVLAGGIAHDFNNLLVGILGNASLALSEVSPDSPLRDALQSIETAALRAGELTNQMLAYSGKGRFVVEPLDLNALSGEMAHLLEAAISKKATLSLDLDPTLPAVEGDATQVRQLVMNLITNASDALGDEAGRITLRTWETSDPGALAPRAIGDGHLCGPAVVLEVVDTGCGMDEETASRIFDPFFTTKFTGRGLGLAAALGIVRGHGGAVEVESRPGAGTRFRVLLPASSARAAVPPAPAPALEAGPAARGTVMVVDDEDVVRRMAQRILEDAGFDVLAAADGEEAIERFRGHGGPVAAVLLDLTMPRLGGEETLQRLRQLAPDLPVILTSGYSESEIALRFEGVRLEGFLHKPFRPSDLLERIRAILEA